PLSRSARLPQSLRGDGGETAWLHDLRLERRRLRHGAARRRRDPPPRRPPARARRHRPAPRRRWLRRRRRSYADGRSAPRHPRRRAAQRPSLRPLVGARMTRAVVQRRPSWRLVLLAILVPAGVFVLWRFPWVQAGQAVQSADGILLVLALA